MTKDKLIDRMCYSQRQRSKQRGHLPPTYTKEEFSQWVQSQPGFTALYDEWVESDYDHDLVPSVDRVQNRIGYTLGNIQLGTWKDNKESSYADVKKGNSKACKKVKQVDIDSGEVIAEYGSISIAMEATGLGRAAISRSLSSGKPRQDRTVWQ